MAGKIKKKKAQKGKVWVGQISHNEKCFQLSAKSTGGSTFQEEKQRKMFSSSHTTWAKKQQQ